MSQNPFFSIIIVSLNAEKTIKMTIDSIVNQSEHDYEVIVKDGGSKDQTIMCIPKDGHFGVYIESDVSIYDAMNQAVAYSKGKYLIFMNCGDVFSSSNVLKRIKDSIGLNEYGMVYGDYIRDNILHKQPKKISKFYMYRTPLCHQSIFFNGDYLRNNNYYDIQYKILADYDLELRILSKLPVYYVETPVCTYLGGGVSESKEGIILKKSERKIILSNRFSFMENLLFKAIRKITFPKLRSMLVSSKNIYIKKTYQTIVNFFNH